MTTVPSTPTTSQPKSQSQPQSQRSGVRGEARGTGARRISPVLEEEELTADEDQDCGKSDDVTVRADSVEL